VGKEGEEERGKEGKEEERGRKGRRMTRLYLGYLAMLAALLTVRAIFVGGRGDTLHEVAGDFLCTPKQLRITCFVAVPRLTFSPRNIDHGPQH